jgi:hypothetical protein
LNNELRSSKFPIRQVVAPLAIVIAGLIAAIIVCIRSVQAGDNTTWLILMCAMSVVTCFLDYLDFCRRTGTLNIDPRSHATLYSAIFVGGIGLIFLVIKWAVPKAITGNFRTMGLVWLALQVASLAYGGIKRKLLLGKDDCKS